MRDRDYGDIYDQLGSTVGRIQDLVADVKTDCDSMVRALTELAQRRQKRAERYSMSTFHCRGCDTDVRVLLRATIDDYCVDCLRRLKLDPGFDAAWKRMTEQQSETPVGVSQPLMGVKVEQERMVTVKASDLAALYTALGQVKATLGNLRAVEDVKLVIDCFKVTEDRNLDLWIDWAEKEGQP